MLNLGVSTEVLLRRQPGKGAMKSIFRKLPGPIFQNKANCGWSVSHAQVPVVLALDNQRWRIFYSTRDEHNVSRISFFDVDANSPERVIYEHEKPVLNPGALGSFDDAGVMPTCVIKHDDEIWLYFIGWTVRKSVPYQNSIGLAASKDGINFYRKFPGPVISTSPKEAFFSGTAWIMPFWEKRFVAYYLSCNSWQVVNKLPEAKYDIKVAFSDDGVWWKQKGTIALPADENECLASATVIKRGGSFIMWYCSRQMDNYRDNPAYSYKIKMAFSADGLTWEKSSEEVIPPGSPGCWDCEMQAYPYAIRKENTVWIFYNGNGFGRSGIGAGVYRLD